MFKLSPPRTQAAFTLIELSIVLIIIGLLVGGVLAGRELIEQAKQRSIIDEWQQYQTAFNVYALKYDAVPGDHDEAELFFGAANTNDGNGNRAITSDVERPLVWQHLALAGLISGSYTGLAGPANSDDIVGGVNAPEASYGEGTAWCAAGTTTASGVYNNVGAKGMLHFLVLGRHDYNSGNGTGCFGGVIPVPDMILMDEKYDDGVANSGGFRTYIASGTLETSGSTSGAAPDHNYSSSATAVANIVLKLDLN